MPNGVSSIDPGSARTAEDFVLLLRQARAMSELTFWELEERANAAGFDLDPTALAESLGLASLPEESLVVALLVACGYTDDEIERWLRIRTHLDIHLDLHLDTDVDAPGPGLDEPTAATQVLTSVRARHTLRIPGRGSRRARGSWLRPWILTAAAVVIGIGGIAVILTSVSDDDGSNTSPPVYVTGAQPPRTTGPAPSADPSVPPSTTPASPSTGPSTSPSVSATPAATQATGILRTGAVTLQNGQSLDLDGDGGQADIIASGGDGMRADPSSRHFALEPTATKQACVAANDYQKTVQGLNVGAGVCVRTDKGRYAHVTVTRTGPLSFSYVVWS